MRRYQFPLVIFLTISTFLFAQKEAITFELNGRPSNEAAMDTTVKYSKNPFHKFIGEWTLKEDRWSQNWGGKTETIQIPNHHTVSSKINTANSLLSIIDGPEPNGHIFWSYNPNTKSVFHLSSFGEIRIGTGEGTVNEKGDLYLKLSFEGEAKGTYRIYTYTWITDNEYHMKSTQYDENEKATGLFYEGTFIRITATANRKVKEEIKAVLSVLDDYRLSVDEQLLVYADDLIHMAPNNKVIENKADLKDYLVAQKKYGYPEMKHHIIEFEELGDKILMRGAVTGTFHPSDGKEPFEFRTKNLFVFKRVDGELRIGKVIYNGSPE